LEAPLKVIEVQWLFIIFTRDLPGNQLFLLRDLILYRQLIILGTVSLRRDHEYVMEGNYDWVIIIKIFGDLELLG
jgi:hypothetical protein